MREASEEVQRLRELVEKDDLLATMEELEETLHKANEIVLEDKQMLTSDKQQFSHDIAFIGDSLSLSLSIFILFPCFSVSLIPLFSFFIFADEFLEELVVLMDHSGIHSQLKQGQCSSQESAQDLLWKKLEKKEKELRAMIKAGQGTESGAVPGADRSFVYQEKLREQLHKLAGRMREVESITSVEDCLEDKAAEVWCVNVHF